MTGRPTLWHIPISHFSEKARWALAYKGVEHDRHAPPAGPHMLVALWLTRGARMTFPVLELDGDRIGDSTAIIAALEERFPEPALYPEDPRERRSALDLEEFYDEQLGPAIRRLVFHELRSEPDGYGELAARTAGVALPGPLRRAGGAYGRAFIGLRFRVAGDEAADMARAKVLAALDSLEAALGDDGYLVGGRFTVADLTAAALFYPLVQPPEGPWLLDPLPAGLQELREPLRSRPGFIWVEEMYRRHRKP
ncbi:MAG TPA: glutathione S-transferase family protein [Solirubrobacteraceae bacterium]